MGRINKIMLKNVEVQWARVHEPTNKYMSEEKEWLIECRLSEEQLAHLKKLGCKKEPKDSEWLKFQKNELSRNGDPLQAPIVVDKACRPFSDLIGNGSICNVRIAQVPYEFKGIKGFKFSLDAVQVMKHKKFNTKNDLSGFDMVEETTFEAHEDCDADEI